MARSATAALLVAMLGASVARAQSDGPIELSWRAPVGCPTEADVRQEITRALGGPPPSSSKRRVRALAVVEGGTLRWSLRVATEVDGQRGSRSLEGSSCAALAEAAALIVALAFDADAVAAAQAKQGPRESAARDPGTEGDPREPNAQGGPIPAAVAPSSPVPAARIPASSTVVSRRSTVASSRQSRSFTLLTGADSGAHLGALPGPAVGFGGFVGLEVWRVRIEVLATYWLEQSASVRGGSGGDFDLFTVLSSGCFLFASGRLQLGPCLGLELGRMGARGFGVDNPGSSAIPWVAPYVGALGTLRIVGPLALRVGAGAIVPVSRPRWVLVRVGEVDQPGPVSGRGLLGLEVRW
jgi:hypothetical protein